MAKFSLGVIRIDRIRYEYIRETAQVECFEEKVKEERLRFNYKKQISFIKMLMH